MFHDEREACGSSEMDAFRERSALYSGNGFPATEWRRKKRRRKYGMVGGSRERRWVVLEREGESAKEVTVFLGRSPFLYVYRVYYTHRVH